MNDSMKSFLLRLALCLWPLRIVRRKVVMGSHHLHGDIFIGYMFIYIFGLPVAKLQLTNPWS